MPQKYFRHCSYRSIRILYWNGFIAAIFPICGL